MKVVTCEILLTIRMKIRSIIKKKRNNLNNNHQRNSLTNASTANWCPILTGRGDLALMWRSVVGKFFPCDGFAAGHLAALGGGRVRDDCNVTSVLCYAVRIRLKRSLTRSFIVLPPQNRYLISDSGL